MLLLCGMDVIYEAGEQQLSADLAQASFSRLLPLQLAQSADFCHLGSTLVPPWPLQALYDVLNQRYVRRRTEARPLWLSTITY